MKKTLPRWDFECAIIGGGPGGLLTALYLTRFKRKTVLIQHGTPRAAWGPKVNNLVGYHKGISGKVLLERIQQQIAQIGTLKTINGLATVQKLNNGFLVSVEGGKKIRVKKVVLATGIEDIHPAISNLDKLRRLGLLKYCSICDGFENSNQQVVVLALDDFGLQKALFIGNWTKRVTILLPKDFKIAPQRIREIKKLGAQVVRCQDFTITPNRAGGVVINVDHEPTGIPAHVVYVELGCRVRDECYKKIRSLRRTQAGFIIATTEQRTSVPGLFAVGDCVNLLGQIAVAAGQAAVAATTIHNDLL